MTNDTSFTGAIVRLSSGNDIPPLLRGEKCRVIGDDGINLLLATTQGRYTAQVKHLDRLITPPYYWSVTNS